MSVVEPACWRRRCKHLLYKPKKEGGPEWKGKPGVFPEVTTCAAYPNGIPLDVVMGKDLHLKVREDQDNELVYEKYEE